MNSRRLASLVGLTVLVATTNLQAQDIIYADTFTADDGTILLGYEPETNNGVEGAFYHESNNFWTGNSPVGIFDNRAQLGADNQANLPIATAGDFVQPEIIGVSILMNLGTTVGQTEPTTTGEQRGVGLGFFSAPTNLATPDGFRGLVITTDGRLIFAEHGFGGSARAGFIEEIATGIDTAADHTLSFEVNTTTGDIANIILDGEPQADVETDIFNANLNHVGFMVSSASGGTVASYDDFMVTDGPLGAPAAGPVITSLTQIDTTTWELTVTGAAETAYDVVASETLDFAAGSSLASVTTDENGEATVQVSSSTPKNFLRLQTP